MARKLIRSYGMYEDTKCYCHPNLTSCTHGFFLNFKIYENQTRKPLEINHLELKVKLDTCIEVLTQDWGKVSFCSIISI